MYSASTHHQAEFESAPDIVVSAPGTVNLMGAHTEESDGTVLQMAIDRRMFVAVGRRADQALRFFAADLGERKRTTLAGLKYKREDRWANLPKGVIAQILERDLSISGLNLTISGDVPTGIGLASSAAITSAVVTALNRLFELDLAPGELLDIAVSAERDFMGRTVGASECATALRAEQDAALLFDARTGEAVPIGLPLRSHRIVVIDSRVPISPARNEYGERLNDCRTCVDVMQERKPGKALRDFTVDDLEEAMGRIPENARRRCLHVVQEHQRVRETVEALRRRDLASVGRLLTRSHASLRDLYEVSCPEIDWIVKRSTEAGGVLGARITGNGFGGCAVALVEESAVNAYYERLEDYERIFGFRLEPFVSFPDSGVRRESE